MTYCLRTLASAVALAATPALAAPRDTPQTVADSERTGDAASPAASEYPVAAAGEGATGKGYAQSRWAEDWRKMADPANRDDPLDRLKFLPLDADGDVYVTLSGEARLRVNHTTNPNLREGRAQRQDINRLVAGADLHIGRHFRAYGELAHGGLAGEELGTINANLRNDLVFQQAFVEGNVEVEGVALGVRYGRQEFNDGLNLLVVQRDNNTIRFALNGVRAWARGSKIRAAIYDFKFTEFGQGGVGDDRTDDRNRFSGATVGVVLPTDLLGGSKLYLDPFYWRQRRSEATWGATTEMERRHYVGARLWGDVGPLTLDWTVDHQGGDYAGRGIDAWQGFFAQTYRIGKGATAPRVGFHADYASGGGSYDGGKLKAANAPFGNNIYYSYQLFLTPTNLIAVAPNVSFTVLPKVRLTTEYQWAWRADSNDAVYRANGSAFAGTQLVRDAKIAESVRLQAVWTISPRLSFTGRYEHLDAGPSLTEAGYKSSDFFAGWLSFRF
jgi:hypothetical protein